MILPIKQVVPTLAVLAVLGYCCWPEARVPAARDKGKPRELTAMTLAPKAAPLPARNPFEGTAKKAGPSKDLAKKSADAAAPPKTVAIEESIKQAGSLTLKGTFLSGERRLALINDRFYAEGESLRPSKLNAAWRVAEVQAQRVVLEHQGKQVELKYADRTAKGPAVPAKAGPKTSKGNDVRK